MDFDVLIISMLNGGRKLRIVVAPDSFKGSLSATEAAEAISIGVLAAMPGTECVIVPLADGGEGTVEALVKATAGRIVDAEATDPLGVRIRSFFGILGGGKTAVVEMAAASGLTLISDDERNPLRTTSYGTGELIRSALDAGCREIILGIGGSATNDGGVGAIQALGARFLDLNGVEVGFGGAELSRIQDIDISDLDPRLAETTFTVACDVDNPLTGAQGASAVFGPQKGATPEMVAELDAGLHNLAEVILRRLGVDVETAPGSGAAGGLGAACLGFLGATLKSGIQILLDATNFLQKLEGAALVITGEGRIDSQTLHGKTIAGVLNAVRPTHVPVLALGGGVESGGYELLEHGAVAVVSIVNRPMDLQYAQSHAKELLTRATEQALRIYQAGLSARVCD